MKKIKTMCEIPAVQPRDGKPTTDTHPVLTVYSHEKCPDWVIIQLGEYQITVNNALLDQALRNATSTPFVRGRLRYMNRSNDDDEE